MCGSHQKSPVPVRTVPVQRRDPTFISMENYIVRNKCLASFVTSALLVVTRSYYLFWWLDMCTSLGRNNIASLETPQTPQRQVSIGWFVSKGLRGTSKPRLKTSNPSPARSKPSAWNPRKTGHPAWNHVVPTHQGWTFTRFGRSEDLRGNVGPVGARRKIFVSKVGHPGSTSVIHPIIPSEVSPTLQCVCGN